MSDKFDPASLSQLEVDDSAVEPCQLVKPAWTTPAPCGDAPVLDTIKEVEGELDVDESVLSAAHAPETSSTGAIVKMPHLKPVSPFEHRELFLNDVSEWTTADNLTTLVSSYGRVENVEFSMTELGRRVAYVRLPTAVHCEDAIKALNGVDFMGSTVIVGRRSDLKFIAYRRELETLCKLFIGNIPKSLSKEKLKDELQKLVQHKIVDYKHKAGFCFLGFETPELANDARMQLRGVRLFGKVLNVESKNDNNGGCKRHHCSWEQSDRTLYARKIPKYATVAMLEEMFAKLGTIRKITIPKKKKEPHLLVGYAFIEFITNNFAKFALGQCKTLEIGGMEVECRVSTPMKFRARRGRGHWQEREEHGRDRRGFHGCYNGRDDFHGPQHCDGRRLHEERHRRHFNDRNLHGRGDCRRHQNGNGGGRGFQREWKGAPMAPLRDDEYYNHPPQPGFGHESRQFANVIPQQFAANGSCVTLPSAQTQMCAAIEGGFVHTGAQVDSRNGGAHVSGHHNSRNTQVLSQQNTCVNPTANSGISQPKVGQPSITQPITATTSASVTPTVSANTAMPATMSAAELEYLHGAAQMFASKPIDALTLDAMTKMQAVLSNPYLAGTPEALELSKQFCELLKNNAQIMAANRNRSQSIAAMNPTMATANMPNATMPTATIPVGCQYPAANPSFAATIMMPTAIAPNPALASTAAFKTRTGLPSPFTVPTVASAMSVPIQSTAQKYAAQMLQTMNPAMATVPIPNCAQRIAPQMMTPTMAAMMTPTMIPAMASMMAPPMVTATPTPTPTVKPATSAQLTHALDLGALKRSLPQAAGIGFCQNQVVTQLAPCFAQRRHFPQKGVMQRLECDDEKSVSLSTSQIPSAVQTPVFRQPSVAVSPPVFGYAPGFAPPNAVAFGNSLGFAPHYPHATGFNNHFY